VTHHLVRTWIVTLATAGVAVACGGKVDGGSTGFSSGPSPTTSVPGQRPPSGGRPSRPPPGPISSASIASQIAEAYCKTFSSCCVGSGEPPIDVARCREITANDVEQKLGSTGTGTGARDEVEACVEAIRNRTATCGKEDAKWWLRETHALFGPSSIREGCEALLGPPGTRAKPCSEKLPCGDGTTCAIDECVADNGVGDACMIGAECLDGAVCTSGACTSTAGGNVKAACTTDDACRLGLVCAKDQCAAAREHPELYKARSSPYRVGPDTCSAFSFL
jgi:hypothetical protein